MSAISPAITAMTVLVVRKNATTPMPPPMATEPIVLPRMARAIGAPTKTPTNRKIARFSQSKPSLLLPLLLLREGSGSGSPSTRPMSRSTAALRPPAKSLLRKRGFISSSMMRTAARSGTAPSSVLAVAMRILRSSLATMTRRPSPTPLRPIFQASPTRCA